MSIKGNLVGNLAPRTDYGQEDTNSAEYLKNNPKEEIKKAQETADDALPKKGGTMTGDIDMGSNRIKNVATPTEDGHAVNKKYADSLADGLHKFFTVSLPVSGWSGAEPYTQTAAVPGILAEDHPHWDVVLSDDNDTAIAERDAFAVVDDLDTAANSVTFTCLEEKPAVDLTIQMEVNR